MKIIKPSFSILTAINSGEVYKRIELAARTCYKSEGLICEGSAEKLVAKLVSLGHGAMIEHGGEISVRFICDRGVSHELVRHRLASFAQESTRYVNYSKREIEFIKPVFLDNEHDDKYHLWAEAMFQAEKTYCKMIEDFHMKPEEARSVLPNSLKTEIVVTANIREWQHIFEMRCSEKAHPQMRELMIPLRQAFKEAMPLLF